MFLLPAVLVAMFWLRGWWEAIQRLGNVANAELGVVIQRELGVAVAGKLLRLLHWRACLHEQRNVGLAKAVKVNDAAGLVLNR
ncbi:MAG: hypothetical protein ACPGXK_02340 [Phycisphaerae bacterium]